MTADLPDFRTAAFLREHALKTMAFYDGRCVDPAGGFFHFFKDDGSVYDRHTRHLLSSARFVVTHAWTVRRFPDHERAGAWRSAMRHGLAFLHDVHRDARSGHYAWRLRFDAGRTDLLDARRSCYGLAFVLLAQAQAALAGEAPAADELATTFGLMERVFWEPAASLYADEASPSGELSPYRGQTANMHACEALLAAYEATGETPYLRRATMVAESLVQRLSAPHGGLVWEHYDRDWQPDWEPAHADSGDAMRAHGHQVGHLAQWARLLLTIERLTPGMPGENWLQHRARQLFGAAVQHGWDRQHGALFCSFQRNGAPLDRHKYWWVQAEAIGAAAALGERTSEGGYWDWYDRVWACVWEHFVDHEHGAWFRALDPDNRKPDDLKTAAGKADYHTMGACYEALDALERAPMPCGA